MANSTSSSTLKATILPPLDNYCTDAAPDSAWSASGSGVDITLSDPPVASPVGTAQVGHAVFTPPFAGGVAPGLIIPTRDLTPGVQYTTSVYVYTPLSGPLGVLSANAVLSSMTGRSDAWVRISQTFTAGESNELRIEPSFAPGIAEDLYFAGAQVEVGLGVSPFSGAGKVPVLLDGAETPVTANLPIDYTPVTGDRVLVQRIGGMVEIIRFLKADHPGRTWCYVQDTEPTDADVGPGTFWFNTGD